MITTMDFYHAIDTFSLEDMEKLNILKENNEDQWLHMVNKKAEALLSEEEDSLAKFRATFGHLKDYSETKQEA